MKLRNKVGRLVRKTLRAPLGQRAHQGGATSDTRATILASFRMIHRISLFVSGGLFFILADAGRLA